MLVVFQICRFIAELVFTGHRPLAVGNTREISADPDAKPTFQVVKPARLHFKSLR